MINRDGAQRCLVGIVSASKQVTPISLMRWGNNDNALLGVPFNRFQGMGRRQARIKPASVWQNQAF